jgi:hypothetical protein
MIGPQHSAVQRELGPLLNGVVNYEYRLPTPAMAFPGLQELIASTRWTPKEAKLTRSAATSPHSPTRTCKSWSAVPQLSSLKSRRFPKGRRSHKSKPLLDHLSSIPHRPVSRTLLRWVEDVGQMSASALRVQAAPNR